MEENINELLSTNDLDEGDYYKENNEKKYTEKYGTINLDDNHFDDNEDFGEDSIIYKPEKIRIWTGEKKENQVLTGIEIHYRNIMNDKNINKKEYLGSKSDHIYEFIVRPIEYLINAKIWINDNVVQKLYLKTNKGREFEVGEEKGEEMKIDALDGNYIISSFFGSYKDYLNSIGFILIQTKFYMQKLFIGYFELKAKLRKKDKRNVILEKMENNEYDNVESALVKTCLLPDNQFNEIIKFTIV